MKIIIANASNIPLYQQIEEQIKEAIFTGELQDGDILPSIRNLANDLQVSVLTIRRVYDELEKEGFLVCRVGVGSFISTSNLDKLKDSKRRVLEEKVWDMLQQAKTLGISKEEITLHARCSMWGGIGHGKYFRGYRAWKKIWEF